MRLPNVLWGYVVWIAIVLAIAVLIPAFRATRKIAQRVVCESNLKTLSEVMTIYSFGAYDGLCPVPKEKWCDILLGIKSFKEKRGLSSDTFRCPTDPKGSFSYAINGNIYRKKYPALAEASVVLIFESDLGRNGVGGPDDVVLRHNKNGKFGCHIVFADGHVEFVAEDRIGDLKWTVD